MSGFRKGIVVATHPDDYSVDLVMADDGSRLVGVQVMTQNGSARTGSVDLPAVPDSPDKWDITKRNGQDMEAIVGFVGRNPVVTGFIYPQVNQMTFGDPKRAVSRHQSDVYTTIDGNGNMELAHPSGFFLRVGETPEHEDLVKKNTDGKFAPDRNLGRNLYVRLETPSGKYRVTITPDGDCKIEMKGQREIFVDKFIYEEAKDKITLKAPNIILDGNVFVMKDLHVHGTTAVRDIGSNGVDISSGHIHSGVIPGDGLSKEPALPGPAVGSPP